MFGNHKRLEGKLRAGGRSAPATVLECKAGMTITNGNPQLVANTHVVCKLRLQVTPEGESAFEASTSAQYSQFGIPSEGDTVTVLYDPGDHSKVVVDASPAAAMHQVLAKQVARFRAMNNELGTTIADRLEAANADGSLPPFSGGAKGIRAYNAAFGKIVAEAKESAGLGSGPAIFVGGKLVDPSALTGATRSDPADELTKLAALRDRGVLTDAEFAQQKAKILAS
jgi:hypothetical protein